MVISGPSLTSREGVMTSALVVPVLSLVVILGVFMGAGVLDVNVEVLVLVIVGTSGIVGAGGASRKVGGAMELKNGGSLKKGGGCC